MSAMIIEAVKKAFDLTDAAKSTLSALKEGKNSQDQLDLLGYLFAFAVKDGAVQQSSQFDRLYDVFDQVSNYKKETDGGPTAQSGALPTNEVIFFCDYSRMNENKDCFGNDKEGYACDTVTKRVVKISPMYQLCKYGTVTIDGHTETSEYLLCQPAMINFLDSVDKYWTDAAKDGRVAKTPLSINNPLLDSTDTVPMDRAALLDMGVLHEMTHTVKDDTEDVSVEDDEGEVTIGSYGWNNCVKLSEYSDDLSKVDGWIASYMNADSYGYFGLGSQLINGNAEESCPPQRPQKDGSVVLIG
ncbi:uncharacterized protein N7459_008909 [Penicillium hispanicum]|uniref:uncharacterized protein n=1 Tax=Penicillium hispanicum TaxID=1080232 RepID=UPI00253F6893|nr:uncharacterized protein N7459_008909 [Penicillium hispanicum]KAJ5569479.1 hypothetical protein N7459_008909 [Penicillium hispanicum]